MTNLTSRCQRKQRKTSYPWRKKDDWKKNTPKGANATTKRTEAEAEEEIFYRNNMPRLDAAAVQNSKVSYFLM
jgi:hypothetical protein